MEYGARLGQLFARPGGSTLRARLDEMTNPEYQLQLRRTPKELRAVLPGKGPGAAEIAALVSDVDDAGLAAAVRNLGGHDLAALRAAFAAVDDSRPHGHPRLHPQGLRARHRGAPAEPLRAAHRGPALGPRAAAQGRPRRPVAGLRARLPARPPARRRRRPAAARGPAGRAGGAGARRPRPHPDRPAPPRPARAHADRPAARRPDVGRLIVTVSPDVSSSTNLGGCGNIAGVRASEDRRDWFADDSDTILHWRERPSGRHIELGIAGTDLVGLLGELGATWSRWGQPLLPVGVLYDPFVERALEPWTFGIHAGGQSILVGTPSGVTLAPGGGAHQSIKTVDRAGAAGVREVRARDLLGHGLLRGAPSHGESRWTRPRARRSTGSRGAVRVS